ncbi:MAG: Ig-like domain-containing protein [Gemmataceae bacterium]|nr:Ig-like domain-containing protein [Gemmataceae bacterium]
MTFTATVAAVPPGAGTPDGTVTFTIDGVDQAPVNLSDGTATFRTATLPAGTHTVSATYVSADGNFSGSTSAGVTQTVNPAATTTNVTATVGTPGPSGLSFFAAAVIIVPSPQTVTFTATVAALAPGNGTPAGTVSFFNGGAFLGSSVLSEGISTFTTTFFPGTYVVSANYNGALDFLESSGETTFTVSAI